MSYAVNSTASRHNLDALSDHYLNITTIKYEDVIGKGANKYKNFSEVPIKDATNYAVEDTDVTLQLYKKSNDLLEEGSSDLLQNLDYKLLFVLLDMEERGALIDLPHLTQLCKTFGAKLMSLFQRLHS